jgi:23S rRNA pseudouridine1911/1915/1917 synthase
MTETGSGRLVNLLYEQEASQRLDKFLVASLPEFSRTRLQSLIKDGLVTVDDQVAGKAGQLLDGRCRVVVRIPPVQPGGIEPESIPLEVIYEDGNVLVVNKPAGMVVHPSVGHQSGTLAHAALGHAPQMDGVGGEQRPGIVHRLDKNTSGIILLAKNDRAHRHLQEQFRLRETLKIYLALVDRKPPTPTGMIDAPVGRHPQHRKKMAIVSPNKGRQAVSEFRTLISFPRHTYLEVKPVTGRTHQIRLHLAYINCPVVGDTVYGRKTPSVPLERHFLHASSLTIQLPGDQENSTFHAPLPIELQTVLDDLQGFS